MRKLQRIRRQEDQPTRPLLLCLPSLEKLADVLVELNRYQEEHHQGGVALPPGLLEESKHIVDAPDYREEPEREIEKEMRRPPRRQRRVV